ncbi:MAG: ssDNA-binding domain-containing protein [Gammaproteobacteria bacterium]|nr:ssDNA-binding domain-containing protein [Gammaproteobacteria bacterium]
MTKTDTLYESVTQSILDALEQGTPPWQRSWFIGSANRLPRNFSTDNPYRGINALIFWMMAQQQGYTSHYWLTFKQARELGGCVRKKEKGTRGIFYRMLEKTDSSSGETTNIPMARQFYAFNLDQIDGIEDPNAESLPEATSDENPDADAFIAATGARIEFGAFSPCYIPKSDTIRCPERARFKSAGDYYATATHELTHWTAHESRLARDLSGKFGDAAYAAEELIAELGSAFICADLGIQGTLQEHASYLDHWVAILKGDSRAIVNAASHASKAHQYLMETIAQEKAA